MKPQSAKAKGRNLQKYVVAKILDTFKWLKPDDVTSRSMGAGGEDVLLSPAARKRLPISVECKNKARFVIYKDFKQCQANAGEYQPVLVIKQNHDKPLAVIDFDYFMELMYANSKTV